MRPRAAPRSGRAARRSLRSPVLPALLLFVGLLLPAVPAAAAAPVEPAAPAVPHPFGRLTCLPEYGVRFCRGGLVGGRDLRVPSFDGVPLDADVALPPSGRGPFPLLVLLHGLAGSKHDFETTRDDGALDDVTMAAKGFAVLVYTARGFGDSCGTAASRADTPACAKGWIQLADQRYEVRDTQYLAGLLVDEGLVRPGIAVASSSYGAGQSLQLATLKNRIRLPSGRFAPFVSPVRHVPMTVAAAFAEWPWEDLDTALAPNGHLATSMYTPPAVDHTPVGVPKESWIKLLYAGTTTGYLSPPGTDPQADLTTWQQASLAGPPDTALDVTSLDDLQQYKSAIAIPLAPGGPAPTVIQSGWTDSLFPVSEALHFANRYPAGRSHFLLLFEDVGHNWAQDKPADVAFGQTRGIDFLTAVMQLHQAPPHGVVVLPTTCPRSAPSGPPSSGASLAALQHGSLTLAGGLPQTVTSAGGDPAVAAALNPVAHPFCQSLANTPEPGTFGSTLSLNAPFTLLGAARVRAQLHVVGNYPELVARLWDVAPDGTRQIVAMGVYVPPVNQAAGTSTSATADTTATFELNPNDYTFAAGHEIELELVGSNAPYFLASNGTYRITVSNLGVTLPRG